MEKTKMIKKPLLLEALKDCSEHQFVQDLQQNLKIANTKIEINNIEYQSVYDAILVIIKSNNSAKLLSIFNEPMKKAVDRKYDEITEKQAQLVELVNVFKALFMHCIKPIEQLIDQNSKITPIPKDISDIHIEAAITGHISNSEAIESVDLYAKMLYGSPSLVGGSAASVSVSSFSQQDTPENRVYELICFYAYIISVKPDKRANKPFSKEDSEVPSPENEKDYDAACKRLNAHIKIRNDDASHVFIKFIEKESDGVAELLYKRLPSLKQFECSETEDDMYATYLSHSAMEAFFGGFLLNIQDKEKEIADDKPSESMPSILNPRSWIGTMDEVGDLSSSASKMGKKVGGVVGVVGKLWGNFLGRIDKGRKEVSGNATNKPNNDASEEEE